MRHSTGSRPDQILVIGQLGSGSQQIRSGLRTFAEQHRLAWQVRIMTKGDWQQARGAGFFDDVPPAGIVGPLYGQIADWCTQAAIPMVAWGHDPAPAPGRAAIWIDSEAIAAVAVDHVRESGYPSAVILEGDPLPIRDARHLAFVQAALQTDLDVHRLSKGARGVHGPANDAERGIAERLAALPAPAAVFCYQDREADWLARLCERFGVLVPQHIGIVGVDSSERSTRGPSSLTSVRIPWAAIGAAAGLAIRRLMDDPGAVLEPVVVRPMGVERRDSTALQRACSTEVREAMQLMCSRLGRNIRIAEIAEKVGLPLRTFQRRFRHEIGLGAKSWLQEQRLQHAQAQLIGTDLPIAAIARSCGFSTHAHFSKTYREWAGHTPQELRAGCGID